MTKNRKMINIDKRIANKLLHRKMTINEIAEEWLSVNKLRLKPSTHQRYFSFWIKHIKKHIGDSLVCNVNPNFLSTFSDKLIKSNLSAQSANAVLIFLHSLIEYSHNQYNTPLPKFNYFRIEVKEMRVFSKNEQERLVMLMKRDIDIYKLGVLLALYTGVRIGELCALRWSDIEDKCIRVRSTIQRLQKTDGGTELIITEPKTRHSKRVIPLILPLNDLLLTFKSGQTKDSFIISTPQNPITEPRVMQYKFKKYMDTIGISGASFHTLRHTFATRSIEAGMDAKSLSELLGHSNVQITLNRYVHSSLDQKRKSIEMLNNLFV